MIPPTEMHETLKRVNKWLAIAEDATRKANEEMKAMFQRHEPKLKVIRGGKR